MSRLFPEKDFLLWNKNGFEIGIPIKKYIIQADKMHFLPVDTPRTSDEFPHTIAALAYNEKVCAFAYKKISDNINNSSDPDVLFTLALAADTVRRKQSWYINAMEAYEILYEKIMDHPASTV